MKVNRRGAPNVDTNVLRFFNSDILDVTGLPLLNWGLLDRVSQRTGFKIR